MDYLLSVLVLVNKIISSFDENFFLSLVFKFILIYSILMIIRFFELFRM